MLICANRIDYCSHTKLRQVLEREKEERK